MPEDLFSPALQEVPARRFTEKAGFGFSDVVAVEEPLELRVQTPDGPVTLAVLMRTPGTDRALLLGWLVSEGLLPAEWDLQADPENPNLWWLQTPEFAHLAAAARLSLSSSACGVCGSGRIEELLARAERPHWSCGPVPSRQLTQLPERLQEVQATFARTGGVHGAALFDRSFQRRCAFEDVGRHNAVDKVVGWAVEQGVLPLHDHILCVSSRAGFEIVQKAVAAGIPLVMTLGAASSLAVETALAFGVTLCAFTRADRMTVYSGMERIEG